MSLVDTSAWIEWMIGSVTGRLVRPYVPQPKQLLIPTIVQFELAKWLLRELPERADDVIGFTRECAVVPLDTAIALRASALVPVRRLATADAIIYATAVEYGADLVTCDAHFQGLPGVVYVAKAAP